jgi:two-component system, OmpR family, sensor histidine kinase ChvG
MKHLSYLPSYLFSIRAKLLLVSLILLLIPFIGFRFVLEMERYLREGQQSVLLSAAKFLSASLSDRPQLMRQESSNVNAEEAERLRTLAIFRSDIAASLGDGYRPSEDIERLIRVVAKDASRIWVFDSRSQVRGLAGSLTDGLARETKKNAMRDQYQLLVARFLRFISPSEKAPIEELDSGSRTVMTQVDRALTGQPTAILRYAPDGISSVLSAAQPIYLGDDIVGAVVIEESSARTSVIAIEALQALLLLTAVVFLVGFLALLVFASRLAFRVRRLQMETDDIIDMQGRFVGDGVIRISEVGARDELGNLGDSLERVLGRLRTYNTYLEQMASRLAHELRTPVTVVRSSLDNLRQSALANTDMVYIQRADEGIKRLATLISRMSEATQLEKFLQGTEKEQFDLTKVVGGCVAGYRHAFAQHRFDFVAANEKSGPAIIWGSADAVAQLLDKLVQNAVDFSRDEEAISVGVSVHGEFATLAVQNKGPLLPVEIAAQLFESMISSRVGAHAQAGHLGLGLYVVQLIADFHGAKARASNLPDGSGVRFEVVFPLAGST